MAAVRLRACGAGLCAGRLAAGERVFGQLAHACLAPRAGRDHVAHGFELAEAEQAVVGFELAGLTWIGDDRRATVQGEDGDVALAQTRLGDGRVPTSSASSRTSSSATP